MKASFCDMEEGNVQFDSFSNEEALELGLIIVRIAKEEIGKGIAVHIENDEHPLFTHYMEGTSQGNLPLSDYQGEGGSFPIRVRGQGKVGTVTVSGLTGEDDHQAAVDGIRKFLARKR